MGVLFSAEQDWLGVWSSFPRSQNMTQQQLALALSAAQYNDSKTPSNLDYVDDSSSGFVHVSWLET